MNPILLSLTQQQNFFHDLHLRFEEAPYFKWIAQGNPLASIAEPCFLKDNNYSFTDGDGRRGLLFIRGDLRTVVCEEEGPRSALIQLGRSLKISNTLRAHTTEAFVFAHPDLPLTGNLYALENDDPLTIGSLFYQLLSVYMPLNQFPTVLQDSIQRYLRSKTA